MFTQPLDELSNRSVARNLARGLAVAGGVVLASVLALANPATAQASEPGTGDHVITLPPAPRGADSAQGIAQVAPTISPGVSTTHVAPGNTYTCASGNLCAWAWNPTNSLWKVFRLYYCDRYYLSYWQGDGGYDNFQTGGVTVRFYGESGNVLRSFTATGRGTQNWNPVWSIRNC